MELAFVMCGGVESMGQHLGRMRGATVRFFPTRRASGLVEGGEVDRLSSIDVAPVAMRSVGTANIVTNSGEAKQMMKPRQSMAGNWY